MNIRRKKQSGFTMIEILIVIAIIGILATVVAASSFMPTLKRGRDTKRKHDLAQIATALEGFANDHGVYPRASVNGEIMGCGDDADAVCEWGRVFRGADGTVYMAVLPQDKHYPERSYWYEAGPNGKAWRLYARLENVDDLAVDRNRDGEYTEDDEYTGIGCGDVGDCNYGISSSNVGMEGDLTGY